ncbi:hypothetical protein FSP39_011028 [Pinctada imbricata]|uniref:GATOR complex protein NPRL3 n=1 Tax=Pinctada imbricata TaxID=66713 RepID=A0AA88XRI4_PINIB|nr:hypothetical protein FSP39_011028 [Pinctada imbricata]
MLLDTSKTKLSSSGKSSHQIISFNIVFALRVAIHHEEGRCQYLSTQAKIMISVHDEVAALPEDSMERESPFDLILQRSSLARDLRSVLENICDSGVVHMFLNKWIEISYCMPHKIHFLPGPGRPIRIEVPYHGILLLEDRQILQESFPSDCSPAISRVVTVTTPLQSLQVLSLESDLSLSQIFQVVSHLVYWAKAIIIYPLCETNLYVLSPTANIYCNDALVKECAQQFDKSLPDVMADFSSPTPLSESKDILNHPKQQEQKVKMVVWMLQKHLLIQLHTYIIFSPPLPRSHKKYDDSLVRSAGMPSLPEEESVASFSDIASVNSDESYSVAYSSTYNSQISKSPSDSSSVLDDKSFWPLQDGLAHLTKEEKEAVYNVPASKNLEDIKLFTRLCPYFNGKHHMEEIMYYENLSRSQLMTVIDKFRQVLISCQYEDPATSFADIT